jgi:hypothetical protein
LSAEQVVGRPRFDLAHVNVELGPEGRVRDSDGLHLLALHERGQPAAVEVEVAKLRVLEGAFPEAIGE